jgi:hypothetical protein
MGKRLTPAQQQEMLETSLRNVRDLVDLIEAEDASKRTEQRRLFVGLAVAALILVVVVVLLVGRKTPGTTMTIPAAPAEKTAPR